MDFYADNNLNKTEFKSELTIITGGNPTPQVFQGYPFIEFSFTRNLLAFRFSIDKQKKEIHISNLEFYDSENNKKSCLKLFTEKDPRQYSIQFKTEETCVNFHNILNRYLELSGLTREKQRRIRVQHQQNEDRGEHDSSEEESGFFGNRRRSDLQRSSFVSANFGKRRICFL